MLLGAASFSPLLLQSQGSSLSGFNEKGNTLTIRDGVFVAVEGRMGVQQQKGRAGGVTSQVVSFHT